MKVIKGQPHIKELRNSAFLILEAWFWDYDHFHTRFGGGGQGFGRVFPESQAGPGPKRELECLRGAGNLGAGESRVSVGAEAGGAANGKRQLAAPNFLSGAGCQGISGLTE